MAVAAPALLLAASFLLQPGDAAGAGALFGRLARGPRGAVRRLSGDENATFRAECKAACSGLDDMEADNMELMQGFQEQGEAPDPPWAPYLGFLGIFCDHRETAQCFLDHPEECGTDETFEKLTPKLACICDSCSRGKLAFAKLMSMGDSDDEDDDEGSQDGQGERRMAGTTTAGFMPDTTEMAELGTTTMGASGNDFDWDSWFDNLTNFTFPDFVWPNFTFPDNFTLNFSEEMKGAVCASYALGTCIEEYPEECASLGDLNVSQLVEGPFGETLGEMCTGEFAPGAGDDDDDSDGDGDGGGDVVGGCGPVGLGWLAASVPPAMAAFQFAAA